MTHIPTPQQSNPSESFTSYSIDPFQFSMILKDSYLLDKLIKHLPQMFTIAKIGHSRGDRYYLIRLHPDEKAKPQDSTRLLRSSFPFAYFISPAFNDTKRQSLLPCGITNVTWVNNPATSVIEQSSRETLQFIDDHHFVLNRPMYTYYPGYLPWVSMHRAVNSVRPLFAEYDDRDCRFHNGKG